MNVVYSVYITSSFYLCSRCDFTGCELKFKSKCSLKKHLKKHVKEEVKCPNCELRFNKHVQLKSHMFIHDGIKPFK